MKNKKFKAELFIPEIVYLDELTLSAQHKLLGFKRPTNVIVLDVIKPWQRLWGWLLKMKRVHIFEATFFAGHLRTEKGGGIPTFGRRIAGQIALKAAKQIVQSARQLYSINKAYGRNTIQLFIAKQLHLHIEYWTFRVLVAQALYSSGRALVLLKEPTLFDGKLLVEAFPGVELRFYSIPGFGPTKLVRSWFLDILRDMKLTFGLRRHNRESGPPKTHKPAVLVLQEDTIRADLSLRGQPHWIDIRSPPEIFETYVVQLHANKTIIPEDEQQLSEAGVKILSTSSFRSALYAKRDDKTLLRVRQDRRTAIRAVFQVSGFNSKFFLLRIASLLRQAELMSALALWLNAKVFLIRETYYSFADAMQLVAPNINVITLAYQYSNMGAVSPTMMSTADKFLVFSDMYRALYHGDGIAPQDFVSVGYLYDGIATFVLEKARKHREIMMRAGAKFIVCYFDESVQHDRWGLVSKDDHLSEIHILAKTVLADPTFGVVVKSQFVRNSPSLLYPTDEIIHAAKATGRYHELVKGVHRNDIYPTEAALMADLCISHKFGATAALEAAIAGVKTVLLDLYGINTLWDHIYSKAAIVYESIDGLMAAIARYRDGDTAEKGLGDWRPIIDKFDPFLDGKAAIRLRGLIEQLCTDDNDQ